jgi:hypothetical protein
MPVRIDRAIQVAAVPRLVHDRSCAHDVDDDVVRAAVGSACRERHGLVSVRIARTLESGARCCVGPQIGEGPFAACRVDRRQCRRGAGGAGGGLGYGWSRCCRRGLNATGSRRPCRPGAGRGLWPPRGRRGGWARRLRGGCRDGSGPLRLGTGQADRPRRAGGTTNEHNGANSSDDTHRQRGKTGQVPGRHLLTVRQPSPTNLFLRLSWEGTRGLRAICGFGFQEVLVLDLAVRAKTLQSGGPCNGLNVRSVAVQWASSGNWERSEHAYFAYKMPGSVMSKTVDSRGQAYYRVRRCRTELTPPGAPGRLGAADVACVTPAQRCSWTGRKVMVCNVVRL